MKGILLIFVLIAGAAAPAWAHHNDTAPGTDGPNGRTLWVGTPHDDDLRGGNGPDVIRAGRGNDRLGGEHGPDMLYGGPGDDRIWTGRSPDVVVCGRGFDVVHRAAPGADTDSIADDCEVIR